jgi:endothelin-converting enzyme/putative endopeptidase
MLRRPATLAFGLVALLACTHAVSPPERPPAPHSTTRGGTRGGLHFDVAAVNAHADPCVDFYDFACGGWRATHPIPPDRTRWSRYAELQEANLERERSIVEQATHAGSGATPAEKRIGAFFAACMDEAAIENRGLAPLHDLLARIDAAKTQAGVMDVIAELQAHGVRPLFDAYVGPDPHEVRRTMLTLDRGFLGMPSRGDYTSDDPRAVALRAAYRGHLVHVFRDLGAGEPDAGTDADRVVALETALAKAALTPVEERDPDAQVHPLTMAEVSQRYPALALPALLAKIGAPPQERVNVAVPKWMDAVQPVVSASDLAPLRAYLRALVARAFAPALPAALERERFDFEQRQARGAREMKPRWQRCLSLVDDNIGDDVGRMFLAMHFGDDARARVRAMVDRLLTVYRAEIQQSAWLGTDAKRAALAKLGNLLVVIGGSNRLRNLDPVTVNPDDLFGDVWRARAFEEQRELALLSRPTDREEFFDTLPQDLDGFTAHEMLGVGFTAGFLQPPVFDERMDDAVNFGGLGGVIGHELTHELDDEGRKYDVDGNLRPWWSPEDVAGYEARAQCFVDEYSRFHTEEGTPLDGKLTLGENLADNGGLRLSYESLHPSDTGPKVDGFTPAQRFFLAWGQIRCENVTPETERRQALTDGHSAGRWRVNGVVSNLPEFARAFSCPLGAPMAPERRCRLW